MASRIVAGQHMQILPTTRNCFYCCSEGKEHPLERFTRTPCCGHHMCIDCRKGNRNFCGECLSEHPKGGEYALLAVKAHPGYERFRHMLGSHFAYLIGRIYLNGHHTYFDEIDCLPLYEPVRPQPAILSVLNPSNPERAIECLKISAENGYIPATLALADLYDVIYSDHKSAEFWYQRALGKEKTISPIAITRYGFFLRAQGRSEEAKNMFRASAGMGHVRGQFEYAEMLLSEKKPPETNDQQDKNKIEAVEWLCKASEKGYYFPSYILLARVLIESAEEMYEGRADRVGRSPLSRAYQMLKLAKQDPGMDRLLLPERESFIEEIDDLLARYQNINICCASCGEPGTESNPLLECTFCGIFRYCSKICRKKHFRDGHGIDCCLPTNLFRFDQIKKTLLFSTSAALDKSLTPDKLIAGTNNDSTTLGNMNNNKLTLRRMVDDFTDEVNNGEDEDYDAEHLSRLMLKMRKNLETYLAHRLNDNGKGPLAGRIQKFVKKHELSDEFVTAIDVIRNLGNIAAHFTNTANDDNNNDDDDNEANIPSRLNHRECREAVENFLKHWKEFESIHSASQEEAMAKNHSIQAERAETELPEEEQKEFESVNIRPEKDPATGHAASSQEEAPPKDHSAQQGKGAEMPKGEEAEIATEETTTTTTEKSTVAPRKAKRKGARRRVKRNLKNEEIAIPDQPHQTSHT